MPKNLLLRKRVKLNLKRKKNKYNLKYFFNLNYINLRLIIGSKGFIIR